MEHRRNARLKLQDLVEGRLLFVTDIGKISMASMTAAELIADCHILGVHGTAAATIVTGFPAVMKLS